MRLAILVGGMGRRIGREKAEVKICGKKLVEIALEKFRDFEVALICRDEEQARRMERYGVDVFCDEFRGFGAIAGIHAAVKNLGSCIVVAVDMPFVKPEVVERIYREGVKAKCDALLPVTSRPEPLLAFYASSALVEIEKAIKAGVKRIIVPLQNLNVIYYPASRLRDVDPELISFFNVNTPSDLAEAERICSSITTEGS